MSPSPSAFQHTVVRIKCRGLDGNIISRMVDAFLHLQAPGLALVMVREVGWNVTHLRTGMRLTPYRRTRGPLENHLLALAKVFPWATQTVPSPGTKAFHELAQRVQSLNASSLPTDE